MKRNRILILLLLAAVLLCGCLPEDDGIYNVTHGDTVFTVDTVNRTISDGKNIYSFSLSGRGTTITYPDGSSYWWSNQNNIGYGGWSDDYDPEKYVDGDTLIGLLSVDTPSEGNGGSVLLGLLLLAVGAWYTISPSSAWYLAHGWRFKDAEPSDMALGMYRLGGIVSLVIGAIALFGGIFS